MKNFREEFEEFKAEEGIEEIILVGRKGGIKRIVITKGTEDFVNKIRTIIRNAGKNNFVNKGELLGILKEEEQRLKKEGKIK